MTEETAKAIGDYLLAQTEQEFATTKKVLAAVPAENLSYKPAEKCMNGLDLAGHIAAAEVFFLSGVVDGKFQWAPPKFENPGDALTYYEKTVPELIGKARAMSGAKLIEPLSMGPMNMSGLDFLAMNLKHTIHHRGQLSTYLRPMGGKVPGIYGPSGDDKPASA